MIDYERLRAAAEVDPSSYISDQALDAIVRTHEASLWSDVPPPHGKELLAEFDTLGYEIVIPHWAGYRTKDGVDINAKIVRWRPL